MKTFLLLTFTLVFSPGVFAQTPTDHAGRTLDRTSTTGYAVVESAVPSYIENPSLTWRQSEQGDEGLFFKDQDDSVVIFTNETTVRRFLSPMGNAYRFWQEEGSAAKGGFPIPLVDQPTFDNFLQHYQNRYAEGMKWCEVVDNPWGPWQLVGIFPTGYGVQSYTEERVASTAGKADLACPLTGATTESRTLTVDNGPAPLVVPDSVVVPPIVVPPCTHLALGWLPDLGSYFDDTLVPQYQTLPNCTVEYQNAYGTVPRAPMPVVYVPPVVVTPPCAHIATGWLPDLGGYYNDVLVNTYRTLSSCVVETGTAYGLLTRVVVVACTNNGWSPDARTVALGQYFTRTDNSGNPSCTSGGYGTMPPVIACTYAGYSPATNTVSAGQFFTQHDNSGNPSCNQWVPGTKVTQSCSYGGWSPATSSVQYGTAFTQTDSSGYPHCTQGATGTKPLTFVVTYSWSATGFLAGGFGSASVGGVCSQANEQAAGRNGYVLVCMFSGFTWI